MDKHYVAAVGAALALCLLVACASLEPEEQESPATPEFPTGQSAQRVYLDPNTGQLTSKPPPGVPVLRLSAQELEMLSRSDAGLIQQPVIGGGFRVDLRGRYRHMATATIGPDGKLQVRETIGEDLDADNQDSENDPKQQ